MNLKNLKSLKNLKGIGGFVEFLDFFDIVMANRVTARVIHQSGKHRMIGTIIIRLSRHCVFDAYFSDMPHTGGGLIEMVPVVW